MMKEDGIGPLRTLLEQMLVPSLGLAAGVRKEQRCSGRLEGSNDVRHERETEVAGPWKALDILRQNRAYLIATKRVTRHHSFWPRVGAREHLKRFHEIADRRRKSDCLELR